MFGLRQKSAAPSQVKISVCVPVYNTEETLGRALDSIVQAAQGFDGWEILAANDGSPGRDADGRNCKKIVRRFIKENGLSKNQVIYIEHKSNLGLLEARRTLVQAARGDFVAMLDSDDQLLPGALETLWKAAQESGADIIHAAAIASADGGAVGEPSADGKPDAAVKNSAADERAKKRAAEVEQKANNIFLGALCGPDILDGFLTKKNHSGFLWAKLIRRSTYLAALERIPFSRLVFAEDFLQYFFISRAAKKYFGISAPVYRYAADTGISSLKKIASLDRWEQVCSAANVFAIIFSDLKEVSSSGDGADGALSFEQMEALRFLSRSYLANNLKQMEEQVAPQLQEAARAMLCDYWGEDFVQLIDKNRSRR